MCIVCFGSDFWFEQDFGCWIKNMILLYFGLMCDLAVVCITITAFDEIHIIFEMVT